MKIKAVSHPIPTEFAKRIYDKNKTVYVGKSHLSKVSKGDKFVLYESYGAKAFTGWADIKFIGKMKPLKAFERYKDQLMLTEKEFKEYTQGKDEVNIIEFENFKKFKNPVKPKRYVSKGGKYPSKEEITRFIYNS
jgi:hypothetical protein